MRQVRRSFLKTTTNKRLLDAGRGFDGAYTEVNQSFFASFCSQKEALTFIKNIDLGSIR
jgi:hypothetical protein